MTLYAIDHCLWQLRIEYDVCIKNNDRATAQAIERGFANLHALKKRMEKEPDSGNCTGPETK